MYRVLIVEDERIEREGLAEFIDWSRHGLELSGTAGDGVEGLEKAEELRPDLVITDIKMPEMDGLQMISRLRQRLPEAEVLLVSGYEDFAYAQRGIQLGVRDYLLKPLDDEEFLASIEEIVARLDTKRRASYQERIYKRQLIAGLEQRRELALQKLLRDELNETEVEQNINLLEPIFRSESLKLSVVSFGAGAQSPPTSSPAAFYRQAVGEAQGTGLYLVSEPGSGCDFAILRLDDSPSVADIERSLPPSVSAAVIRCDAPAVQSPWDLPRAFREAKRAAFATRFFELDEPLSPRQVRAHAEEYRAQRADIYRRVSILVDKLSDALRVGDETASTHAIEGFVGLIREFPGMAREDCDVQVSIMVGAIAGILRDRSGVIEVRGRREAAVVAELSRSETLSHVRSLILELAQECLTASRSSNSDKRRAVAEKAVELIHRDYARGMSIRTVAQEIGLSPNYIGAVFRTAIGKSFNEYLTEFRMHRAKELLDRDSRVKEVAAAVGIQNTSYFCGLFRSAFGVTPGEYRDAQRLQRT
jgi:two-component system response regulator YesN